MQQQPLPLPPTKEELQLQPPEPKKPEPAKPQRWVCIGNCKICPMCEA